MKDNLITLLVIVFLAIIGFIGYIEGYRSGSDSKIVKLLNAMYTIEQRNNMEYQITLDDDSIVVWDDERYVGSVHHKDAGKMDTLFLIDNQ